MVIYSINDLEKLSGVKAHTLRIWEKRYNLLNPKRTETNIRYYLDQDLQLLLNVAFLNKRGFKISKIAEMNKEEIKHKVAEYSNVDVQFEEKLDALTLAMFEFDEYNFNKIIDHNINQIGFKETMLTVIYPLLDKITMMWIAGSVKKVNESFIVNLIRKKTISQIDKLLNEKPQTTTKYLIYLSKGENQELSLLFLEYILRVNGFRVLNLGLDVDYDEVCEGIKAFDPEFIMSIFNESFSNESLEEYISKIVSQNKKSTFVVSGFIPIKQRIKETDRCILKNSLNDIMDFISN